MDKLQEEEEIVAEAHLVASQLVEWFRKRLLTSDAARDAAVDARVAAEDDRRDADTAREAAVDARVAAEDDRRVADTQRVATERHVIEVEQLLAASEELTERLEQALESRIVIEQAKGYLAAQHGVTTEAAFEAMRRHARSNRASLRDVAAEVMTGMPHLKMQPKTAESNGMQ